ncbi:MAG: chromosome condensation regulator RCC1 [Actinomycetota bacterium]
MNRLAMRSRGTRPPAVPRRRLIPWAAGTVLAATAGLTAAPLPAGAASVGSFPGTAIAGWGQNDRGELGTGTASAADALLPVLASLPPGTAITTVAPGCNHSLALTSTGAVLAWGDNALGELGNGAVGGVNATPERVKLPAGVRIRAISGGCGFSLAVTTGGQVYAWGSNVVGELGTGHLTPPVPKPVLVDLPPGMRVKTVAAGEDHALAVTTSGQVLAWGPNDDGELGNGTTAPGTGVPALVKLPANVMVAAVSAGENDSLAVTATGRVLGWGDGSFGSLGDGRENEVATTPVHTVLPAGTRVQSVFAGCFHTLAVTTSGAVLAWGDNGNGQIGNGSFTNSRFPVRVILPMGTRAVAVGGGCVHSQVVTSQGQMLAWGAGGLLGNGAVQTSNRPVLVRLAAGQLAIGTGGSAVGDFSLALLLPVRA